MSQEAHLRFCESAAVRLRYATRPVAESFFGTLKMEFIFGTTYSSRSDARQDIVDYIEMFYNSRRRHSFLGCMSPMEFEKQKLWEKAA